MFLREEFMTFKCCTLTDNFHYKLRSLDLLILCTLLVTDMDYVRKANSLSDANFKILLEEAVGNFDATLIISEYVILALPQVSSLGSASSI